MSKKELTNDCPKCSGEGIPMQENEYVDNVYMLEKFKCEDCGCIYSVTFKVDEVEILEEK